MMNLTNCVARLVAKRVYLFKFSVLKYLQLHSFKLQSYSKRWEERFLDGSTMINIRSFLFWWTRILFLQAFFPYLLDFSIFSCSCQWFCVYFTGSFGNITVSNFYRRHSEDILSRASTQILWISMKEHFNRASLPSTIHC